MIRPMALEDINAVYEIENASFFDPRSKSLLREELENNGHMRAFVYEVDGEILGYYYLSLVLDEGELFSIAVNPTYRQKGVGTRLLDHMISYCRQVDIHNLYLEVSINNQKALALYEKFGFEKLRLRKCYYQKTMEDAYEMKKELK